MQRRLFRDFGLAVGRRGDGRRIDVGKLLLGREGDVRRPLGRAQAGAGVANAHHVLSLPGNQDAGRNRVAGLVRGARAGIVQRSRPGAAGKANLPLAGGVRIGAAGRGEGGGLQRRLFRDFGLAVGRRGDGRGIDVGVGCLGREAGDRRPIGHQAGNVLDASADVEGGIDGEHAGWHRVGHGRLFAGIMQDAGKRAAGADLELRRREGIARRADVVGSGQGRRLDDVGSAGGRAADRWRIRAHERIDVAALLGAAAQRDDVLDNHRLAIDNQTQIAIAAHWNDVLVVGEAFRHATGAAAGATNRPGALSPCRGVGVAEIQAGLAGIQAATDDDGAGRVVVAQVERAGNPLAANGAIDAAFWPRNERGAGQLGAGAPVAGQVGRQAQASTGVDGRDPHQGGIGRIGQQVVFADLDAAGIGNVQRVVAHDAGCDGNAQVVLQVVAGREKLEGDAAIAVQPVQGDGVLNRRGRGQAVQGAGNAADLGDDGVDRLGKVRLAGAGRLDFRLDGLGAIVQVVEILVDFLVAHVPQGRYGIRFIVWDGGNTGVRQH